MLKATQEYPMKFARGVYRMHSNFKVPLLVFAGDLMGIPLQLHFCYRSSDPPCLNFLPSFGQGQNMCMLRASFAAATKFPKQKARTRSLPSQGRQLPTRVLSG